MTSFYVLSLGGCDVVLGVKWLEPLGPILRDFSKMSSNQQYKEKGKRKNKKKKKRKERNMDSLVFITVAFGSFLEICSELDALILELISFSWFRHLKVRFLFEASE